MMKVEYIDHMGNDNSVVNAARVSFAKEASNYTDEQNHKLITYLAKYSHWSPFAHTSISLRLKAPIAIHAQFMKHTVGFAHNTFSRRYVSDTPELYVPEFRNKPTGNIKQGSGETFKHYALGNGDVYLQKDVQRIYQKLCNEAIEQYDFMVNNLHIAPEQARFVLPQGVVTEWVSTGSLYAWARLYNLRTDSHAQKEIQDLAKMIGDNIKPLFPISWKALTGATDE